MTGTPWEGRPPHGRVHRHRVEPADGGYHEHHGEFFDLPSLKICPVPTEKVPILVGGHLVLRLSPPAPRRLDPRRRIRDDLGELIERVKQLVPRVGSGRRAVPDPGDQRRGLQRRRRPSPEDKGVTDVIVGFRWPWPSSARTPSHLPTRSAARAVAETTIAACR